MTRVSVTRCSTVEINSTQGLSPCQHLIARLSRFLFLRFSYSSASAAARARAALVSFETIKYTVPFCGCLVLIMLILCSPNLIVNGLHYRSHHEPSCNLVANPCGHVVDIVGQRGICRPVSCDEIEWLSKIVVLDYYFRFDQFYHIYTRPHTPLLFLVSFDQHRSTFLNHFLASAASCAQYLLQFAGWYT